MGYLEAAKEVIARCRALAAFTDEPGWTTRPFLCPSAREVHREVSAWMCEAGMRVRTDAAGNLRGDYPGVRDNGPALLIGSHLDTVPRAGAFDGILGVMLGIALVKLLAGRRMKFWIEVAGFSEEEGVRFALPFIGSRALIGELDPETLERRDSQGISIHDAIREFGLDSSRLPEAVASPRISGYLEFHIEQGPVLESLDLPLGVVEAIAGQSRLGVTFQGRANHAGTTPMHLRHDALAGAAEWISSVEREVTSTAGLVATVGQVQVEPGAGNVIAGRAVLSLDVRHSEDQERQRAVERILRNAEHIAQRRGLTVSHETRLEQAAIAMDPRLTEELVEAVAGSGFPIHRMHSGAGHDAMILARRMPVAMLFLRSPDGISHHPDEEVLPGDVAAALQTGMRFLEQMEARCA